MRRSILLVEDDVVVRDMIRGVLEQEYNMLEASTCSETKRHLSNPADLALIDYMLPDGNGLDILRMINETKPELPVILMTAYSTENLAIKAFREGVTDYLRKPISLKYLVSRLAEILEGKENCEHDETVESREVFIMDSIAAFIEENYAENLTRDELAKKACMNNHKFSRLFNEHFGEGVKSYINRIRLERAAELLKNRDLSVATVATLAGYGGIVHFERLFKDAYGISPSEYRRTHIVSSSAL